jgi:hypothetical protein
VDLVVVDPPTLRALAYNGSIFISLFFTTLTTLISIFVTRGLMRLLLIVLQTNQRHLIPGRSRNNARPLSCRLKSCDVDDCEMMDDSVEGGGSLFQQPVFVSWLMT